MLAKSLAIVIGSVKYGDSSVILKCYSRNFGLISFIAGGVRGKKGGMKSAMMLPLNQGEVVFYEKGKSSLRRLKEFSSPRVYSEMYFHPVKNCLVMFLAEVLSHVLKEEEPEPNLFDFLSESLFLLDSQQSELGNFHLTFLYNLSAFLGFQAQNSDSNFFDLQNGVYLNQEPLHPYYLKGKSLENWKKLSTSARKGESLKAISSNEREDLLKALMSYYRLHINDFGELKSLEVLQTILH